MLSIMLLLRVNVVEHNSAISGNSPPIAILKGKHGKTVAKEEGERIV